MCNFNLNYWQSILVIVTILRGCGRLNNLIVVSHTKLVTTWIKLSQHATKYSVTCLITSCNTVSWVPGYIMTLLLVTINNPNQRTHHTLPHNSFNMNLIIFISHHLIYVVQHYIRHNLIFWHLLIIYSQRTHLIYHTIIQYIYVNYILFRLLL